MRFKIKTLGEAPRKMNELIVQVLKNKRLTKDEIRRKGAINAI